MNYIYKIVNEEKVPVYVGITKSMEKRFMAHKNAYGFSVEMVLIIMIEDRVEALAAEQHWIKELSKQFELKNCKDGVGRKKKDPRKKMVPVTAYVKFKNKAKAKKLIDKITEGL